MHAVNIDLALATLSCHPDRCGELKLGLGCHLSFFDGEEHGMLVSNAGPRSNFRFRRLSSMIPPCFTERRILSTTVSCVTHSRGGIAWSPRDCIQRCSRDCTAVVVSAWRWSGVQVQELLRKNLRGRTPGTRGQGSQGRPSSRRLLSFVRGAAMTNAVQ